jgi:hypothetical protein
MPANPESQTLRQKAKESRPVVDPHGAAFPGRRYTGGCVARLPKVRNFRLPVVYSLSNNNQVKLVKPQGFGSQECPKLPQQDAFNSG